MTKAVVAVWRINACVFTAAVIDETFVYYAGYNQRISASLKKANAPYKCRYRKTKQQQQQDNGISHSQAWPASLVHRTRLITTLPSQQIGWEERLRNDLFCVEWEVKPCSIVV